MKLELLYKDDAVEVSGDKALLANAKKVMFSFTGIGVNRLKAETQPPEFVGTASGQGALIVITDLSRSWGNHVDWSAIDAAVRPYIEGRSLYSIGNSMGGFLSVLATSIWPISTAIAFVPQYSLHPEVLPQEERWQTLRKGILAWPYPSLAGHIHADRTYHLFFGDFAPDMVHARCFPGAPNVHRYIFPGAQHGIAGHLKQAGVLNDFVSACVNGSFELDAFRDRIGPEPYAMSQVIAATPTVVPSDAPQQVAPEALREKLAHDRVEAERRRSRRDSRKASLSREERESRWAERFMRAGGSEEKARERLDERSKRGSQRSSAERDARRAQRRQDMSPEDREARRARRAERRR